MNRIVSILKNIIKVFSELFSIFDAVCIYDNIFLILSKFLGTLLSLWYDFLWLLFVNVTVTVRMCSIFLISLELRKLFYAWFLQLKLMIFLPQFCHSVVFVVILYTTSIFHHRSLFFHIFDTLSYLFSHFFLLSIRFLMLKSIYEV